MKTLGNISPAKGSNKGKKRVGRGIGSTGKTSGRGHGGMNKRRGALVNVGFEGGQMPMYRRLPKRGFWNPFRVSYDSVNLDQLNRFDGKEPVTPEVLHKAGLIRKASNPVKLLGRGKLEKALTLSVHKASASASEALVKAGGKLQLLKLKPVEKPEATAKTAKTKEVKGKAAASPKKEKKTE